MLQFGFGNYEGFKEIFGMRECGNGNKQRRNKILLAFLKDKTFVKAFRRTEWRYIQEKNKEKYIKVLRNCSTMAAMRDFVLDMMVIENVPHAVILENVPYYRTYLMGSCNYDFYSTKYEVSEGGICYDGDFRSIRYRNVESDHIYKMKAGKFFRHIIDENPIGEILPEQIKVWLCEDFAERWQAYARSKCPDVTLKVGNTIKDFEAIYDDSNYEGNFGSCMAGNEQYYFYRDAVDAKAAWLEKEDGSMVARCIIFTNVKDEDDKKWRLAERQYSSNGENGLKRLLVDKLIEAGEIDGYKQVGVDCHSGTAFVDNDGRSLSDVSFHIWCGLECDDTLSYQDSFKFYDLDTHTAYNHSEDAPSGYYNLDTTDSRFNGGGCWSEYNNEYIPEREAYYDEERDDNYHDYQVRYCVNTNDYRFRDDCVELANGDWAYYGRDCEGFDDVFYCNECGQYFLGDDGCYSELTDQDYCCEDCRDAAEQEYMRRHKDSCEFAYDEVDEEWYRIDDYPRAIRVLVWNWEKGKRKNALTRLENKLRGRIFKYGTNWYYGNADWNTERCVYEPREKVAC